MHQLNHLRISVPALGRMGKKDEIYGQSWLPRETPLEEKHKPLCQKPEIPAHKLLGQNRKSRSTWTLQGVPPKATEEKKHTLACAHTR